MTRRKGRVLKALIKLHNEATSSAANARSASSADDLLIVPSAMSEATSPGGSQSDVQALSTQGAPGGSLVGEDSSAALKWQAWPSFISSQRATGTLVKLPPTLGNRRFSTLGALELLREHVYDLASYQTRHTKKVDYRHGCLLPRKKKGRQSASHGTNIVHLEQGFQQISSRLDCSSLGSAGCSRKL